jgi:hypothetical protein
MKGVALAASTAFRGVCDQRSGALVRARELCYFVLCVRHVASAL